VLARSAARVMEVAPDNQLAIIAYGPTILNDNPMDFTVGASAIVAKQLQYAHHAPII
jgi:hypothetical protein